MRHKRCNSFISLVSGSLYLLTAVQMTISLPLEMGISFINLIHKFFTLKKKIFALKARNKNVSSPCYEYLRIVAQAMVECLNIFLWREVYHSMINSMQGRIESKMAASNTLLQSITL